MEQEEEELKKLKTQKRLQTLKKMKARKEEALKRARTQNSKVPK